MGDEPPDAQPWADAAADVAVKTVVAGSADDSTVGMDAEQGASAIDESSGAPVGGHDSSAEIASSLRLFGSRAFFRLWLAQVASSLGDWVGTIALIPLSFRIGGSIGTGLVLTARFLPGFFLAPLAGVLVDRLDRKKVMVACDLGRAVVLASMPFVNKVWGLVTVSFLLELLTLLWSPAKEASVPNLVRPEQLATVGSLSMGAAYGTFPLAAGLSALLFKVAERLAKVTWLRFLRVNNESVLIYFDVLTFITSAILIATLTLPRTNVRVRAPAGAVDFSSAFAEMREGWRFIGMSPIVRAVMVGMGTGLIGGGLVIPLGEQFTRRALGAGKAGYSLVLLAMGLGAATGVVGVIALQKRLPRENVFCASVFGGGLALFLAASMSALGAAVWCVGAFGLCAGAGFVLGNTILQADVEDALRGRIFAAFYALIRISLVVPLLAGPFVSSGLNRFSQWVFGDDEGVMLAGAHLDLPGVRLTLWLGALVMLGAAFLAIHALGRSERVPHDLEVEASHP